MRVLILEDSLALAGALSDYLELRGCAVDLAFHGQAFLDLAKGARFDVYVLDVAVPGIDGLEVCERLRSEMRDETPVIFLTARDTLQDKKVGFARGADDYLVKPFEMEELLLRLQALTARGRRPEVSTQVLGEVMLDHGAGLVVRNGRRIRLHELQWRVLKILAARSPLTVERAVLERELWGDHVPDSDALRTHIYRLRNALTITGERELIETVHGKGWRLVR
ncbi:response regulator transcription factor [Aquincola tertiaricarbonis]|uniref:response regulator transcription factor n=1 Tax=Aquincola tertiaricarbonis TaxID=391953 RepID=UPI000614D1FC|nr:response regulator transcription factor [Aquincola tertiaricarbonis]